jgi:hypothetical protein
MTIGYKRASIGPLTRLLLILAIAVMAGVVVSQGKAAEAQGADAPSVTAVGIVSDADAPDLDHLHCRSDGFYYRNWASGYYAIGDSIEVALTFDRAVTVTGSPSITVALGPSRQRTAQYTRTSGKQIIFAYTVQKDDVSTTGVSVPAGSILLGTGDAITGNGVDANLAHSALAAQASHKVDGVPPTVTMSQIVNTTQSYSSDTLSAEGDMLIVIVTFSESVAHHRDKPPTMVLDLDGAQRAAKNDCLRFGPAQYGYYYYEVQRGDYDGDGFQLTANSLAFPAGGYIKDIAGNDAELGHPGHAPGSRFKVDARPPRFLRARTTTDGQKVVVIFDEKISIFWRLKHLRREEGKPIGDYIRAAFTVRVDDQVAAATDASRSDTAATIVMENPIRHGQKVTVEYVNTFADDPNVKGVIADHYRNLADSFAAQPVKNNVEPRDAPTNLVADSNDGQVSLSWTSSDVMDYTAQTVMRRVKGVKGWSTVAELDMDAAQYVDQTGEVGTTYIYRIKSVDGNGQGKQSKPVTIQVR